MRRRQSRRTSIARGSVPPWAVASASLAAAGGLAWVAYSAFATKHGKPLPPALPGTFQDLSSPGGRIHLYSSDAKDGVPLLLVHSINAAASAYELRPIYLHYGTRRPVYAIDLPGYGLSERRDRTYTPREMTDAIHAAVAHIRASRGDTKLDLMALSVSCEYAARAALERPDGVRSLALVSPTGFDKALSGYGRAQTTKGSPLRLALLSVPLWSQALFDLVVSRPSMRFFLRKTFGSDRIDEGLFAYDQLAAHQPGARHVVWSFLSGFLFADDVTRIYKTLSLPIWTCHGRRGDFVDFSKEGEVADKPNWHFDEFDTGAMPQFERLDAVIASYDKFLDSLATHENC